MRNYLSKYNIQVNAVTVPTFPYEISVKPAYQLESCHILTGQDIISEGSTPGRDTITEVGQGRL